MSNESKSFGEVYCFTNKVNDKKYVGRTIDFERRKNRHFYFAENNIDNTYFHNAIRKYGRDNFKWEILCECNSKEELDEKEKYYIKALNTKVPNGYNLTDGGEGVYGYKHTNETKKKLSEIRSGKNNPLYGRKLSDETKQKLSKSLKGNKNGLGFNHTDETKKKISENLKGKTHTDETKKKISESQKGNKKGNKNWKIMYPNGDVKIISGLRDWCKENGFSYDGVRWSLRNNKPYKGYKIDNLS